VQNTQLDLEGDTKLKQLFLGPYEITSLIPPVNVQLKDPKTGKQLARSVHINKVKKYIPSSCQQNNKDGRSLHDEQLPVRLPLDSRTDPEPADADEEASDVENTPSDVDSTDDHVASERSEVQRTSPDVPHQHGASEQNRAESDESAEDLDDQLVESDYSDGTEGADISDVPDVPDVLDECSISDVLDDIDFSETLDSQATDYTEETDDEEYFLVDKIMRVRNGPNGMDEYYVSYLGYPKMYNQWITETDMSPNLLRRAKSLKLPRAKARN